MSDRLSDQISVAFEELEELLATYRPLMEKVEEEPPDAIELAALAAMLHSFYNGVENLLKRILIESGEDMPVGDLWHRELLDQASVSTQARPAIVSESTCVELSLYLAFRHVFRHSYTFDLQWEKMRDLVLECEDTLTGLRRDVFAFLGRIT